jgi:hypothetical protein
VIDRDSAQQELTGLAGADDLVADLEALVAAGLLDELPGVAGTRFRLSADVDEHVEGGTHHDHGAETR